MKKKTVSQIFIIIGTIITILGMAIDAFISSVPFVAFDILNLTTIATILYISFIFSKKNVLINIGYLVAVLLGLSSLTQVALVDSEALKIVTCIGYIVTLIGAILYFFVLMLSAFGFVKESSTSKDSDIITILNKYKEMEKENTLSAEEFETLKNKLLKQANKEITSIEDLKKWKKLYDQKIITEEEFTNIKSSMLTQK